MKHKFFFATILLLGLFGNKEFVWGQTATLKGKIIDQTDGSFLVGATAYIDVLEKGTSADANGNFILTNLKAGTYKVKFSYIGYETKTQKISLENGKTISITVALKEQSSEIDEVVVTSKSEARKLREQAMPISVITINQMGGTVSDVNDVLNKTVGVTLRQTGGVGSATRLSLRGLEGKRVGFFIDEAPLSEHSDFINFDDIPIDLIDRIEIFKGVVPAKFGGSSMGGAVNIVIKEYPDRYGDFSYEIGQFNTHRISSVVKRNIKEKGLLLGIGGGYTYSDNNYTMESPYIKGLKIKRNHDKFKKLMIGGAFESRKWWFDKVVFEPVYVDTYREIQGIEFDIRKANTKSRAYILSNDYEKENFFIEGLDFDMNIAAAYTEYGLVDTAKQLYDWYGNPFASQSSYGGELGERYASNSSNRKLAIMHKLNLEYLVNEQHTFNFNSYFQLANGYPKDDLRELSLGAKTVFNSKMRSWVAGLTYDFRTKDDKFLNSFTTRYYIYAMKTKSAQLYGLMGEKNIHLNKQDFGFSDAMRYRFTPTFLAKLSGGYDVRIPAEGELLGDGYTITPSEELLPERNANVNFGVMYDLVGKSSSNLQLELGMFYMRLENMIRLVKGFLGAQYQNFGEMQTLGVELEAKADIFSFLYGYGNVTFQDLRDVRKYREKSKVPNPTKGMRMPNIPYFLINAGLEFHKENLFGGKEQNTRLMADFSFVEEYYYDFEMSLTEQRRIPRSFTFDLGIEQSFLNDRLFLSVKAKNLTNAIILSEFNRPLPGRYLGAKIRYVFK